MCLHDTTSPGTKVWGSSFRRRPCVRRFLRSAAHLGRWRMEDRVSCGPELHL
jgi:hypothetical protein